MTPIESIYEMESILAELREPLHAKSAFAVQRARKKYEQLVDRFFRENPKFADPGRRRDCLDDPDHFLNLLALARETYYSDSA